MRAADASDRCVLKEGWRVKEWVESGRNVSAKCVGCSTQSRH